MMLLSQWRQLSRLSAYNQALKNSVRLLSTTGIDNKNIRIGCASGFWGDTSVSAPQLVNSGNIDYLVFDYLSEITMSLLARAKQKNPEMGYAPDFVRFAIGPLLPIIKKKGIRVISNAGGINPTSCAAALQKACEKAGVDLKIATVTGDDLMSNYKQIAKQQAANEAPLPKMTHTMNAYLGAGPIARALDLGADIVITGRCVDSAVTLAPLMHEFKWDPSNLDLMAAGSLAGHIIECGAQATGGICTEWESIPDWDNIGFPIVECAPEGDFLVTKPKKTGGVVNEMTVAEQIVYEIGDPERYVLPDVTCNLANVQLKSTTDSLGEQAVQVTGAKGSPAPTNYKVSATYMDGFRASAVCPVVGPNAAGKAEKTANAIIKRCRRMFKYLGLKDFTIVHLEFLGSEHNYGKHAAVAKDVPREVISWMAVQHEEKQALDFFAREVAPAGTGMAPGLTNIVGGRPRVSPILRLHSFLVPKDQLKVSVTVNGETEEYLEASSSIESTDSSSVVNSETEVTELIAGSCTYPLGSLAYTRSGDKGNSCNIGVVCRDPAYYNHLKLALTSELVAEYFEHYLDETSTVTRYELPGIHGFNFMLENSLGGGGIASLRSDPQGKAMGQMLLDMNVPNLPELDIKS